MKELVAFDEALAAYSQMDLSEEFPFMPSKYSLQEMLDQDDAYGVNPALPADLLKVSWMLLRQELESPNPEAVNVLFCHFLQMAGLQVAYLEQDPRITV